jgi:hypothetical protein
MRRTYTLLLLISLGAFFSIAHAGVVYNISMNTAPLGGHPASPFSLEFQLNDGSGTNDGNNTATLTNFVFNGGAAVGSPTLTGGATGNLTSGLSLTDSSFFNQFIQGFMPGGTLSFQLSLSTNIDSGGTPDQFSFAILDKTGTELPTLAPGFFDVFVQIDIDSANPLVRTFGTDTSRSPEEAVAQSILPLQWLRRCRRRAYSSSFHLPSLLWFGGAKIGPDSATAGLGLQTGFRLMGWAPVMAESTL